MSSAQLSRSRGSASTSFFRIFGNLVKRIALVHCDMISFVAFDFILRIFWATPAHMTFIFSVFGVLLYNHSGHFASFRIPPDMVSNRKIIARGFSSLDRVYCYRCYNPNVDLSGVLELVIFFLVHWIHCFKE
ncbi:putative membrane protein [Corynebacterium deserti GIMN1.010]|uniref:Putative membrane protein n=1 Tax=Corynebacterium deserti GIMN1.010 TaxID=931089 RepID=A0A0M4CIP6_9CORY|nr:putative membrane protein [Corynebacterium deserti GIMN1.010]